MLGIRNQSVNVSRLELINVLEQNKNAHAKEFKEAFDNYKKATIKALKKALELAQKGDFSKTVVNITEPQNHEQEFTQVLEMLKMSVDETINLDSEAFQAYVKNNWPWRKHFELVAASYKG